MRLSELLSGVEARVEGGDVEISSLCYDSRRVRPGSLFAALVGEHHDGHDHVSQAIARGAAAVLVERRADTAGATRVTVRNTRRGLAQAARCFHGDPTAHLTMAGVTGTNGKTTTVHLLESVFRAAGRSAAVIGTLGMRYDGVDRATGLTTPESADLLESLAAMRHAGVSDVAMEVSSHALAQDRVAGLDFDVGIFTNLTHDHLDYHGDLDRYFAAKARLFEERLKPGGMAVLNLDDPRLRAFTPPLSPDRVVGFGLRSEIEDGGVRTSAVRLDSTGIDLGIRFRGETLEVHSPLVGRFNASNVLGAVAAALALRVPADAIRAGVAALTRVPGRLERIETADGPLVLVDYAHTPDALTRTLQAVRELGRGRVICVFGCGGDRDPGKRPVMGEVAVTLADWSVVTTDNPRSEDPSAIVAAIRTGCVHAGAREGRTPDAGRFCVEIDRAAAIELAIRSAQPEDVVLVAGKGHETYQRVGETDLPFDDRAQARAALAAAGFGVETQRSKADLTWEGRSRRA